MSSDIRILSFFPHRLNHRYQPKERVAPNTHNEAFLSHRSISALHSIPKRNSERSNRCITSNRPSSLLTKFHLSSSFNNQFPSRGLCFVWYQKNFFPSPNQHTYIIWRATSSTPNHHSRLLNLITLISVGQGNYRDCKGRVRRLLNLIT